jgi:hypothetical protein
MKYIRIAMLIMLVCIGLSDYSTVYYDINKENIHISSGSYLWSEGTAIFTGSLTADSLVIDTLTAGYIDVTNCDVDTLIDETYAETLVVVYVDIGNGEIDTLTLTYLDLDNGECDTITGMYFNGRAKIATTADSAAVSAFAYDIGGATISGSSADDTVTFTGYKTYFNHDIYVTDTIIGGFGYLTAGTSILGKNNTIQISSGGSGCVNAKLLPEIVGSDTTNGEWFGKDFWPGNTETHKIYTPGSTTGAVPIVQFGYAGGAFMADGRFNLTTPADSLYITFGVSDTASVTGTTFYYHVKD